MMYHLILSEHPYRAILARLSSVPEFSTYVTEREVTKKIGGMEYKTYTTLHRADHINLSHAYTSNPGSATTAYSAFRSATNCA